MFSGSGSSIFFIPIEQLVRPFNPANITTVGLVSVLTLDMFSSALMFFLIQVAIQKTSAFIASLYRYLGPFSASITAISLLGEKPMGTVILSGILIIAGVFYATSYQQIRSYTIFSQGNSSLPK